MKAQHAQRLLGLLALGGLVLGPLAAPVAAGPFARPPFALTDSVVAYWDMDEASGSRADSAGSNTLTDVNTVASTTGLIGNSALFVAANSEALTISDNAALSMGDVDMTIGAWVYITDKSTFRAIVGKYVSSGNQREYYLAYNNTSDRFTFGVSGDGVTPTAVAADNFGSPSTSTWYYVVAWHDATANTINIQVDNGTANSAAHTTGIFNGTSGFSIGAYQAGVSAFWTGRIDEVGIWKRVLSADERTWLYNGGAGCTHSFAACDATATPTSTNTSTTTATSTSTSTATVTQTPTETLTPPPGATSTPTDTPTSTETSTTGPSSTPTNTPTVTLTPLVSDTPTPTETATPAPTATPPILVVYTLDSGHLVWLERRADFGQLAIFLALIVLIALTGLRFLYELGVRLFG